MNSELSAILDREFARYPILRAAGGATNAEVLEMFGRLGAPPNREYGEFLCAYGAAMVGSWPIYGLRPVEVFSDDSDVESITKSYRSDGWSGVDDWVIISNDQAGNPVGLDRHGSVLLSDHDYGQIVKLADSFDSFLLDYVLKATV